MRLVWHIAKKDLRRMALPAGFLLAFIVASTVFFRLASAGGNVGPGEAGAWMATMGIWVRLQVAGGLLLGYLLAGALVIEDELISTTGFWLTRPIAGGRMLAAKIVAAGLLFVVAPTIALVPLWLAFGLDLTQTMLAAGEFAMWQAVVTLLALGVSSLAGSLARYLFYTIGLAVAYSATSLCAALVTGMQTRTAFLSREILMAGGALLVMAAVLTQQFLTRRPARAWLTIGLALMAGLAIRIAWPWDFLSEITVAADAWRLEERAEDRAAQIVVTPSLSAWNRISPPNMKVAASWTKNSFYMPVLATVKDGSIKFRLFGGWGEAGVRRLGLEPGDTPLTWHLGLESRGTRDSSIEGSLPAAGKLEIWSARATVLGEIPLREGAEFSSGAVRTRIVGLQRTGDQLDGIFVEEHDTSLGREDDSVSGRREGPSEKEKHFDCYVLVDHPKQKVQALSFSTDFGSARMNSLSTGIRRLFVGGTKSWDGAVLVKVRIVRDRSFLRPFEVKDLVIQNEEAKP